MNHPPRIIAAAPAAPAPHPFPYRRYFGRFLAWFHAGAMHLEDTGSRMRYTLADASASMLQWTDEQWGAWLAEQPAR